MANIRINSLPADVAPNASDVAPVDGLTTRKVTLTDFVNAGRPFASQAEAEAGVNAVHGMSPLTTAQAIAAQGAVAFASSARGVPSGGTLNQVLGKTSGSDFAMSWRNAGAGDLVSTNNLSDVANTATALANLGGQPVDSDLTAIAALSTTAYGRSLLTLANSSALATEIASFYQPLDSDLSAIAALSTTAYGRSLLTMAANADLRNDLDAPVYVADYAAMLALDTAKDKVAEVYAAGGQNGKFVWSSSNLSTTILGPAITSTAVNSTTEVITKAAHGLHDIDPVIVTSAVNGLSLNTVYWVIGVDANNFKLASSLANVISGTAVNLTGTTNFSVKRHYDVLSGVYVYPAADISGASGAWIRQRASLIVYPEWFGALGDGSTDDINAINYAVILLGISGGGELHFSAKRYSITRHILVVNIPITITGEGEMSTFIEQVTLNTNGIFYLSDSGSNATPRGYPAVNQFYIRDISIVRAASTGGNAIDATWNVTTSLSKQFVATNVRVWSTINTAFNWAGGIKLTGCSGTFMDRVVVAGNPAESALLTRNPYTMAFAIKLDNPTNATGLIGHTFVSCTTQETTNGLWVNGWHEGVSTVDCVHVHHEIGVKSDGYATSLNPDFLMTNCHIDARWIAVSGSNTFKLKIANSDLFKSGPLVGGTTGFAGNIVNLVNCSGFSATGTTVSTNDTVAGNNGIIADANSGRGNVTGCHITGMDTVGVTILGAQWNVDGNGFYTCGQGIALFGADNIIGINTYLSVTTPIFQNGVPGSQNNITYNEYILDTTFVTSGASVFQTATFAVPSGLFATTPVYASLNSSDAPGRYLVFEFDRTSSTATSAVFKMTRSDAVSIPSGASIRLCMLLKGMPG